MKIGRNDPCPCGSGKKYKKCCGSGMPDSNIIEAAERFGQAKGSLSPSKLPGDSNKRDPSEKLTFMESLGRPNLATAEIKRMEALMEGKSFGSEEELQAFFDAEMRKKNETGIKAFFGLSPQDMYLIQHESRKAFDYLVDLRGSISDAKTTKIPLLRQTLYLLNALKDGPLDLTQTGALKPAFVAAWFDATFLFGDTPEVRAAIRPRREGSNYDVLCARNCCERARLVSAKRSKLYITAKGAKVSSGPNYLDLYRELFPALLELYADDDHEFNVMNPWLAGHSVLFGLYVLGKNRPMGFSYDEIAEIYKKAFPEEQEYSSSIYPLIFAYFGCIHPATSLGLVDEQPFSISISQSNRKIKASAFYDTLVRWKK